jgi:ArsR family transcriptional regulator
MFKVLFLCATNGLHSPMAEAMLRRLDSEHFEATSAGITAGRMHPLTGEVLKEVGIDLEQKMPKSLQQIPDQEFDYVITLGEVGLSYQRKFSRAETVHWKFDRPCGFSIDPEKQLRQFRIVRDQILQRLRLFVLVHVRAQSLSRPVLLSMAAQPR